ncbi:uncharacterized membrane protein YraQ (UPF0718 family) [Lachnospiraceae bacterium PF1-21]
MTKVKKFLLGNKFLAVVVTAYIILFIATPSTGISAIKNSLYYFKEMLIIMPVIMLLTALLEAWIPKETIQKHLGKGSGIKGGLFAFLLGSFSAGPIYAAFPVSVALLKKGASISNIVILLSTWAVVKVPMLANEAKFLGPKFMLIRWVLTSISIFVIGYITSKFVKREEVLKLHESGDAPSEKIAIHPDYCIGCGLCAKISPNHFQMENDKAIVTGNTDEFDNTVLQAAEKCPAKAITIAE